MDLEQLKLILDTISGVSNSAATIAILFIVLIYTLKFVICAIVIWALYKWFICIGKYIHSNTVSIQTLNLIFAMFRLDMYDISGDINDRSVTRLLNAIEELQNAKGK